MNGFYTLKIQPLDVQVDTQDDLSLLEAADLGRVNLPSSCRNGTCRTCMCRLLSGEVHYRIDWPGLSADEQAQGWVLPCVAVADSDVVIEQELASVV